MQLNPQEKQILRDLASRYMEIASLPVQAEKRDLWKALNRSKMERPMVVIDQLPWNELSVDSSLICQVSDPFWRGIEWQLRTTIYKWEHFPVDMVVEPFITIPKAVSSSGYGIAVQEDTRDASVAGDVLSHHYINQLETEEDIERLADMHITHDAAESEARFQAASGS